MKHSAFIEEQLRILRTVRRELGISPATDLHNPSVLVAGCMKRLGPPWEGLREWAYHQQTPVTVSGRSTDVLWTYHNSLHLDAALAFMFTRRCRLPRYYSTLMALLMHDVHHSHGLYPDTVNVHRAVSMFMPDRVDNVPVLTLLNMEPEGTETTLLHEIQGSERHFHTLRRWLIEAVVPLVRATEFPHQPVDGFTKSQSQEENDKDARALINIRAIDCMSGIVSDRWFNLVYEGLYLEQLMAPNSSALSFREFCDAQIHFMMSWPSEWYEKGQGVMEESDGKDALARAFKVREICKEVVAGSIPLV